MFAQIADLGLCALMSLRPYVPTPFCLCLYAGFRTWRYYKFQFEEIQENKALESLLTVL